jgi:hypothetical protein
MCRNLITCRAGSRQRGGVRQADEHAKRTVPPLPATISAQKIRGSGVGPRDLVIAKP